MIPADILTALIVLFIVVVPLVVLAGLGVKIAAKRQVDIEHRSPPSGARATHSASAAALAEQRADLPKLTPAPIRPDVRGPCDEPAAFSRGGDG